MGRILILSYGTRGDVQPLIALALGLKRAGHHVTLGADHTFEASIVTKGIAFAPLRLNLRQFLNTETGKQAMQTEKEHDEASFDTLIRPMLDDCWQAAQQGVDLLIYDTMLTPAYHIADKLNIPAVMSSVMPNMSPTSAFPLIGAPRLGWNNRLSYQLYRLSWRAAYKDIKSWTETTLGITPRKWHNYWQRSDGRRVPIVYSYSQSVLPSPADWPTETLAAGYWFLPAQETELSAELQTFLAQDPTPIYIGFGSMVGGDPAQLTAAVIEAVQKTGQRAVLATGWGGLTQQTLPSEILALESVPHEALFPHVSAVVHHGGAGTTAAGLRFGKPSVLCPFVTDQFFWGKIVHERGWGPRAIPQKEVTAERLAEAIHTAVTDDSIRNRVAQVQRQIASEDGVGTAVRFIEARL